MAVEDVDGAEWWLLVVRSWGKWPSGSYKESASRPVRLSRRRSPFLLVVIWTPSSEQRGINRRRKRKTLASRGETTANHLRGSPPNFGRIREAAATEGLSAASGEQRGKTRRQQGGTEEP
ncbi:hypothetical protein Droror1_Dr00010448 [Drosera rotundifolia]